jgi:WD40 repeat protein
MHPVAGPDNGTPLALHDAQSVVAREYGFESWLKLRDEVRVRVSIPHGEPAFVILVPAAGGSVRPADRHINRVVFARDGDVLVSAGMDGRIRVWHTGDWAGLREMEAHAKSANTLSFHADGSMLTTGSSDGTAKV